MKIKIDKKIWLIIGIAIVIAALVGLVRIYRQQVNEQGQLTTSLATQQGVLRMLATEEEDQQNKLKQAESLFDTSRAKFPVAIESIEYGEDFFKVAYGRNLYTMAAGCGVELSDLTASKPGDRAVGAVTYSVSSFVVNVRGNLDNVLKFVDAIGTRINYKLEWSFQLPWSVEVKSISMDIWEGETTAVIALDIYGYKG